MSERSPLPPGRRLGAPVLNFPFTWDKQAITHPLLPTPQPSTELKHTLLACVPAGPAPRGAEVVSE